MSTFIYGGVMVNKSEQLLSVEETAFRLGLKPTTIRRKLLERKIPAVKIGKAIRIPIEAVNRIINEGWREPFGVKHG